MSGRNSRMLRSAVCVLAVAGLASTLTAQTDRERERQETRDSWRQTETQTGSQSFHLEKANDLIGADVQNAAAESIASISDLILEPGSGRITHAVISSGGVAGVGGKELAVPFSRLRHDQLNDAFTTDLTEEQIDAAPEFDPEQWTALNHTSWMEELRNTFDTGDGMDRDRDMDMDSDRFGETVRGGEPEELHGTVTNVESRRIGDSGDAQTVLTIETDDGQTKRVVLGPSWYVNRQQNIPYRNERTSLEVYPSAGEGDVDCVCCKIKGDKGEVTLRDEQGAAAWKQTAQSGGASRLMLMSDLVGAEALLPADNDTGEIQDVVVEVSSGKIVLAALDPNENFLGVGDDLKGIPWPAVRVVDEDTVRIDATETMITSAEDLPDDVTTLSSKSDLEPAYQAFNVEVPELRAAMGEPDGGMGGRSEVIQVLREGEEITLTGEVKHVTTRTVQGFDSEMTVATIETDEGEKEVVLGPKSHFDGNPLMLSEGDQVTIEAKRCDYQGQELLAAMTLDANGQETALWSGDRPIWE